MELETPHIKLDVSDETLRSIVVWIWKEKPAIIRDVACENCPEHIGAIELENYNLNKSELK